MEIKEVLQLAEDEVRKLREEATEEELSRLDLRTVAGFSPFQCVYGQMTGNCWSERASKLIAKCALGVARTAGLNQHYMLKSPSTDCNRDRDNNPYFTAMECVLGTEPKRGDRPATTQIVNYLKGETDHLDLVGLESLYV